MTGGSCGRHAQPTTPAEGACTVQEDSRENAFPLHCFGYVFCARTVSCVIGSPWSSCDEAVAWSGRVGEVITSHFCERVMTQYSLAFPMPLQKYYETKQFKLGLKAAKSILSQPQVRNSGFLCIECNSMVHASHNLSGLATTCVSVSVTVRNEQEAQ